jgi:hypothetical protein
VSGAPEKHVPGAPGLWPRPKSLLGSNFRRAASWCLAHYSITASARISANRLLVLAAPSSIFLSHGLARSVTSGKGNCFVSKEGATFLISIPRATVRLADGRQKATTRVTTRVVGPNPDHGRCPATAKMICYAYETPDPADDPGSIGGRRRARDVS